MIINSVIDIQRDAVLSECARKELIARLGINFTYDKFVHEIAALAFELGASYREPTLKEKVCLLCKKPTKKGI